METTIDKAAIEYARHASKAPDKETPDWIITDFKAGAKWERENGYAQKRVFELESKINNIKILCDCIDFTTKEAFKQDIKTLIKVINDL